MKKRGYKQAVNAVPISEIDRLINEYVHSQRDRKVLKLALLNNLSYTQIAGRLDMEISSRTVQEVMNRWMPAILEHL